MRLVFCPTCRLTAMSADAEECGMCIRHRSYGLIVDAILFPFGAEEDDRELRRGMLTRNELDGLEALAEMWIERGRVFRRHNREMFEEQRGAQREARESYHEGLAEGRAQGSESW